MRSIPPECIAAIIVSSDEGLAYRKKMADRTGLEPATSGVTGRHSNQLNYRSETLFFDFGGWYRDRTCDPRLVRAMLYQLS